MIKYTSSPYIGEYIIKLKKKKKKSMKTEQEYENPKNNGKLMSLLYLLF